MEGSANCPRCGDTADYDDRFCSSCGLDLMTYSNLWPEPVSDAAPEAYATGAAAPGERAGVVAAHPSPAGPKAPESRMSPAVETPRVPTYLGWAAVLVILCWPAFWAGIPALVHAGRAESRLDVGDLPGAREAAAKARIWCWVTFWSGILLWTVALTLVAIL